LVENVISVSMVKFWNKIYALIQVKV
jgi:hypothetical protein